MAENNLYGTIENSDSDLNGTMYEYSASQQSAPNNASDVKYDNSSSGLTAENVQEAIDEIAQNGNGNGSGGASSYNDLTDKPSINGVILEGEMTSDDLKLERGEPGVGIKSVEQTVTSTEDGGENEITITTTDGVSNTVYIKNGSKGNPGINGSAGIYLRPSNESVENAIEKADAAGQVMIISEDFVKSTDFVTYDELQQEASAAAGFIELWKRSSTDTFSTSKGTSKTIPGISNYNILIIIINDVYPILMWNSGTVLTGLGGGFSTTEYNANSSNGASPRTLYFTVSGDTLTAQYHRAMRSSDDADVNSTAAISAIYGMPIRGAV